MSRRTTLTLADDVAELIDAEAQRTGRPQKAIVNDALRRGLDPRVRGDGEPFRVEARPMGLRQGIDLTSISGLVAQLEGIEHR